MKVVGCFRVYVYGLGFRTQGAGIKTWGLCVMGQVFELKGSSTTNQRIRARQ